MPRGSNDIYGGEILFGVPMPGVVPFDDAVVGFPAVSP